MSDRASFKNDATVYIMENRILEKFLRRTFIHSMECAKELLSSKPLILDFEIDLILLHDSSIALYKKIVTYPAKARWIFQEALADSLRNYFVENNCGLFSCIQLLLHCKFFSELEDATSVFVKSYSCLSGASQYILTSITIARSDNCKVATICVLYRCPDTNCIGHAGTYRSMEELENIERDYNCDLCGKKCIEDISRRGRVPKVMAKFMPAKAFGKTEVKMPYSSLTCSITDPLTKELELGDMYNICGYHNDSVYNVWGLKRTSFFNTPAGISFSSCPPSICALQASLSKTEPINSWNFVRSLALELGSRIYRKTAAPSLKVGLLLSLASLGSDRCAPILCVGSNIDILEEDVMSYAAKCADRNVRLTLSVRGTIEKSGEDTWQHSGSLVKAKTGVCNVGNWKILKPAQRNDLLEILDDGYIAIRRKNTSTADHEEISRLPQPLPLRTAVWTYYTCKKNCGQERPNFLETLVNLFGIPFYTDANEHTPDTISECVELAINATKINGIAPHTVPRNELIEFLRIVNGIKVTLSEDAVKLMKNYFVACRRARGDVIPAQSITFITTLAEAHARLCLRTEVTYDDVTAVIYLYEESICYLYGSFVSTPPPFIKKGADKIGEGMEKFKTWLKSYLDCLV